MYFHYYFVVIKSEWNQSTQIKCAFKNKVIFPQWNLWGCYSVSLQDRQTVCCLCFGFAFSSCRWWENHAHQLLNDRGGARFIWCLPADFFFLELFDWIFSRLLETGSIFRKTIENVQFAVQQEIFQKNTFSLPPPTLGSVAQSTHAWNSDPSRFLTLSVIYSEKFGSQ